MKNINIAEMLTDCPKGMKLYSPIFGEVYLDKIRPHLAIVVTIDKEQGDFKEEFLYDGRYRMKGECMLFPSKDKNTWEGFVPPYKFKDGDIVFSGFNLISIFKGIKKGVSGSLHSYVSTVLSPDSNVLEINRDCWTLENIRLATEEEKEKLFKAIKNNGYKWNPVTKTLEKLIEPKFKDGDIIADEHGNIAIYKGTMWYNKKLADYYCGYRKSDKRFLPEPKRDGHFGLIEELHYATEEEKEKLFQVIIDNGYRWNAETKKLEKIEPNFKVGDWVTDGVSTCQIHSIDDTQYWYSKNCILGSIESVDKRYHLWTINDAKDGNVISYDDGWTCIFKNIHGIWYSSYCFITDDGEFHTGYERHAIDSTINGNAHPATEEQCNLLFQKMKEAGYAWYSKKKILEEIFPYNIGTKVWVKSDKEHKYIHTIVGISYNSFGNLEYEIKEEKTGIVVHYPKELLIPITKELKFKVGDTIQSKEYVEKRTIQLCKKDGYWTTVNSWISIDDQDKWELVPNKFDINTLKPFDVVLIWI